MEAPPVQYVKTSDGYNIAYAVTGSGQPLVFIPPGLSDIQGVWQQYPHWLAGLAQRFQLIQYDCRGNGLSTRNLPEDLTAGDFDRDIEAVVDRLGLEQFLLWGWATRSHIAIRYAHARPERVAGLILNMCAVSNSVFDTAALTTFPKEEWDLFLGFLVGFDAPPPEVFRRRLKLFQGTVSPDDFLLEGRANHASSVESELRQLHVPTLVLHPRNQPLLPASDSMEVAALIPDARFLLIDGHEESTDNVTLGNADQGLAAIDAFVADLGKRPASSASFGAAPDILSVRELEVLRLLAQGKSNPEIAQELFITRNTVQNHVSSILIKTDLGNRTEAAVYAKEHGLV